MRQKVKYLYIARGICTTTSFSSVRKATHEAIPIKAAIDRKLEPYMEHQGI